MCTSLQKLLFPASPNVNCEINECVLFKCWLINILLCKFYSNCFSEKADSAMWVSIKHHIKKILKCPSGE